MARDGLPLGGIVTGRLRVPSAGFDSLAHPSTSGNREKEHTMKSYVVITGNHTSTKTPTEYVAAIVYGEPKITAVLTGSHFVALCEYVDEQWTLAEHTAERMGSFPHGAKDFGLNNSASCETAEEKAHAEFGKWVAHFSPTLYPAGWGALKV
jgi:hypothetical protein